MSDQHAIIVENLHKTFRLPHEKHSSLKQTVLNWRSRSYEEQTVLKDISFKVKKGEFFGIVGRNGSGKSTLLKTIAGIYQPDQGGVLVNGQLTPFIELGIGFNMELTGRDNVFLNGAILGLSRKEVEQKYQEIVEFSELGKFMDQKLKNYSSGMQVRLAFSIAIQAHHDTLLIDEVLAVGDENFQNKCLDVFRKIKKSGKTVILVTHDMGIVERFCERAIVIHESRSLGVYSSLEAKNLYSRINEGSVPLSSNETTTTRWGSGEVRAKNVKLTNQNGQKTKRFYTGDLLRIVIELESKLKKQQKILVGLALRDEEDTYLSGPNSRNHLYTSSDEKITFEIKELLLNQGRYTLTVAIFDEHGKKTYDHLDKHLKFRISNQRHSQDFGKAVLKHEWS